MSGNEKGEFEYQRRAVSDILFNEGLLWKDTVAQLEAAAKWIKYPEIADLLEFCLAADDQYLRARTGVALRVFCGYADWKNRFVATPIWRRRERIALLYGAYTTQEQDSQFLQGIVRGDVSYWESFGERMKAVRHLGDFSFSKSIEETLVYAVLTDPSADVVKLALEVQFERGKLTPALRQAMYELMTQNEEENNEIWYLVGDDLIRMAAETGEPRFAEAILSVCSHFPQSIEGGLFALKKLGVPKEILRTTRKQYAEYLPEGRTVGGDLAGIVGGLARIYGISKRTETRRRGQPYQIQL